MYGQESYDNAKIVIDSEDPIVIMNKLPAMAKFIKEKS
jgi:hypothetical protein